MHRSSIQDCPIPFKFLNVQYHITIVFVSPVCEMIEGCLLIPFLCSQDCKFLHDLLEGVSGLRM